MQLEKHVEPAKFFTVTHSGKLATIICGNYAKYRDEGSLIVFDGNDNVVAAFAAGEWLSLSSKSIPYITVNTETGAEVHDFAVLSDSQLGHEYNKAMGE